MNVLIGSMFGFMAWFVVRYGLGGLYTVDQNERAVKTSFGRAPRLSDATTLDDPISQHLKESDKDRYRYPQLEVIRPGGPYFKLPWERVYKVTIATQTVNMAMDPEDPSANRGGKELDAVTKDQLNVGLTGQIRFRVSERNLYAYLFAVKTPIAHVMGFFVSVLRQKISNFEAPAGRAITDGDEHSGASQVQGISINDLRKNLRELNEQMDHECQSSEARYGVILDASLITGIDPPTEVESALAAINTAHNHVSSDVSLAHAAADQKIVQSKRAVEIETLKAEAETEPLFRMAETLRQLKNAGPGVLSAYLRNTRLALFGKASKVILEGDR